MATVVVTRSAEAQLRHLQATRSLPASTPLRVAQVVEPLKDYPKLGRPLSGRYSGWRLIPGPWPWLLIIYRIDEAADRVVVVAFQDARTSSAWTSDRQL